MIIPSYNTGGRVFETVHEARRFWTPVWVVVDGSTDRSDERLLELSESDPGLRVLRLAVNQGKGAAVLHGLREASAQGFTHVLTMDADGQHPPHCIPEFMAASISSPAAMILGVPIFDKDAPKLRVRGRKIGNWWANLETLWGGIGDSLYGFRVYPVTSLLSIMENTRWMRRFDFDPEAAVRLYWKGLSPINIPAPVKYFRTEEGGVSHFHYLNDNVLLTWMHIRLLIGFILYLPLLLWRRFGSRRR